MMTMKKEMKCEKKREKEELATYRVRTKACEMRDALRRLSEGFRDRLKRFDSTHDTGKYVRVCMCYLFVLTLFFSLLSFFFSSHTHKRRQKRPLVYVLRIIISSLSQLFFSFTFLEFLLVDNTMHFYWLIEEEK
jgi:hypothetical protein